MNNQPRPIVPEDHDELIATAATPGHQLIHGRIRETIENLRDQLEKPTDPSNTDFQRGQIAGLRIALAIPEILEDEAKEQPHGTKRTRP